MSRNIKEIGKELMGKSLSSYHRKTGLPQIEKNNEMQDGVLNGILSQTNDGYIKKTEQSNVIHLDNSGDGVVILDSIEGNTMVNYCTNGSNELILNDDINVSGINSVTLTGAAEGGKVDVALEGNTMVNVCNQKDPVAITKSYTVENYGNHIPLQGEYDGKCRPNIHGGTISCSLNPLKEGWNIITKNEQVTINNRYMCHGINALTSKTGDKVYFRIKMSVDEFNTTSTIPKVCTRFAGGWRETIKDFVDMTVGKTEELSVIREQLEYFTDKDMTNIILETGMYGEIPDDVVGGDVICKYTVYDYVAVNLTQTFGAGNEPTKEWCDANIGYFEGLKSSFEDNLVTQEMVDSGLESEENLGKYKVQYKVTGKNKFNGKLEQGLYSIDTGLAISGNSVTRNIDPIKVKPNTKYYFSGLDLGSNMASRIFFYDKNMTYLDQILISTNSSIFLTPLNCSYMNFHSATTSFNSSFKYQIEEGEVATSFEKFKEYTKTFYLNSPLLENDTIEDKDGKATHIKRYKKVVLDGSENWTISTGIEREHTFSVYTSVSDRHTNSQINVIVDKLPINNVYENDVEGIFISNNSRIRLALNNSKLSTVDIEGLKTYLQQNPITVVYKLATPQYETISEESILCDSYTNGHLDFDTSIPIKKVDFKNPNALTLKYLYPNTNYILQFDSDNNGKLDFFTIGTIFYNNNVVNGRNTFKVTTPSTLTYPTQLYFNGIGFNASNISVVATDKEVPYFEGMKSVGECEENKIEIISRNRNLWDVEKVKTQSNTLPPYVKNNNIITYTNVGSYGIYVPIKANKNETLRISGIINNVENIRIFKESDKFRGQGIYTVSYGGQETTLTTQYVCTFPEDGVYYIRIWLHSNGQATLTNFLAEISSTNTTYVEHKSDKKEIPLNQPLRAIPNGAKDKIIKVGNKWYVQRNCIEILLDGITNSGCTRTTPPEYNADRTRVKYPFTINSVKITSKILCDKLVQVNDVAGYPNDADGISTGSGSWKILLNLPVSLVGTTDESMNAYLQQNNLTIIAELDTPIYEELEVEPTLNTYTDIAYISNNSTIPCNMKVKNDEHYKCILKPSTLYTVIFDTDKSEDISINLGGSTGNTNRNILTLITPDVLTDDTLRLYGKGAKCSNVRVLEGDKTECIPPYFEGLLSSFEESVTDEGQYKFEILMKGSNQFDYTKKPSSVSPNGGGYANYDDQLIYFDKSKDYWFEYEKSTQNYIITYFQCYDINKKPIYINYNVSTPNKRIVNYSNTQVFHRDTAYVSLKFRDTSATTAEYLNTMITKCHFGIDTPNDRSIKEPKQNKIKLLINEPLRAIDNIKDRLCVKDGKLVVERSLKEVVMNGSENWEIHGNYPTGITLFRSGNNSLPLAKPISSVLCSNSVTALDFSYSYNNENCYMSTIAEGIFYSVNRELRNIYSIDDFKHWLSKNPATIVYQLLEPVYEEVLNEYGQPILLEGYENGTLYIDSTIAPITTVRYTPKMESLKTLKEVSNNNIMLTNDISDTIIPYMMEVDLMIMEKEMSLFNSLNKNIRKIGEEDMTSMQKRTGEMLERLIKGKTLNEQECKTRVTVYLNAGKITDEQAEELMLLISEIYA